MMQQHSIRACSGKISQQISQQNLAHAAAAAEHSRMQQLLLQQQRCPPSAGWRRRSADTLSTRCWHAATIWRSLVA